MRMPSGSPKGQSANGSSGRAQEVHMYPRITCNVCGSAQCRDVALLQSDDDGRTYRALECRRCGLVFAAERDRMSHEQLQAVYDEHYTEEQREMEQGENL